MATCEKIVTGNGSDAKAALRREMVRAEIERVDARQERRRSAGRRDRKLLDQLWAQLHVLKMQQLVRVPKAVRAHSRPAGTCGAELNGRLGTILETKRTRCLVAFAENGHEELWKLGLNDLSPASEV